MGVELSEARGGSEEGQTIAPRSSDRYGVRWMLGAMVVAALIFWGFATLVQHARDETTRLICSNSMRQLLIASQNAMNAHGYWPVAMTRDEQGRPLESWRMRIHPWMEVARIYPPYDPQQPWDAEVNQGWRTLDMPA